MKPSSIVSTLQKQIPKKPPPPTPSDLVGLSPSSTLSTEQQQQQTNNNNNISNNGHNNNLIAAGANSNSINNNNHGAPVSQLNNHQNGSPSLSNASLVDQKPALPPRPANQFNPLLQPYNSALASKPSLLNHLQQHSLQSSSGQSQHHQQAHLHGQSAREKARVVYAYKPNNEDELAMEVGDIIDVLDKNIEDVGWWRGELNGIVGVFPDNFVELITTPAPVTTNQQHLNNNITTPGSTLTSSSSLNQQMNQASNLNANNIINNNNINNNTNNITTPTSNTINSNPTTSNDNIISNTPSLAMTKMKLKLEENLNRDLDKQYLINKDQYSLKRNKLQQQMSLPSEPISTSTPGPIVTPSSQVTSTTASVTSMTESNERFREIISNNDNLDPTTKLNHITANRPKGPNRRPPTDFMKMRHQSEADHLHHQTSLSSAPSVSQLSNTAHLSASTQHQQQITHVPPPQIAPQQLQQHIAQTPIASHQNQQQQTTQQKVQQVSLASFNELKSVVEQLRIELRETRSEMEHHKRYIKEIVGILADERKKFTAIDQGLNRSF